MNIEKIANLYEVVNLKVVKTSDFFRLVDGDLSDLGDALIEGKAIRKVHGGGRVAFFDAGRDEYEIVNPRITIGDVSFPAPEKVAPAEGTEYWCTKPGSVRGVVKRYWSETDQSYRALRSGLVHLNEDAAIEHTEALIQLSGGEV